MRRRSNRGIEHGVRVRSRVPSQLRYSNNRYKEVETNIFVVALHKFMHIIDARCSNGSEIALTP